MLILKTVAGTRNWIHSRR